MALGQEDLRGVEDSLVPGKDATMNGITQMHCPENDKTRQPKYKHLGIYRINRAFRSWTTLRMRNVL